MIFLLRLACFDFILTMYPIIYKYKVHNYVYLYAKYKMSVCFIKYITYTICYMEYDLLNIYETYIYVSTNIV